MQDLPALNLGTLITVQNGDGLAAYDERYRDARASIPPRRRVFGRLRG
jgi:hypothetical protein